MRVTTVGKLREMLEDFGEDCEVRIVHQAGYPLQEVIGGIYDPSQGGCQYDECEYEQPAACHQRSSEDFDHDFEPAKDNAIYLVANGHPQEGSPYGDRKAWTDMQEIW